MNRASASRAILLCSVAGGISACHQASVERTDRAVYSLIEDRQRAALGTTSAIHVDAADVDSQRGGMYSFAPRPADPALPESFIPREEERPEDTAPAPPGQEPSAESPAEVAPSIFTPEEESNAYVVGLVDTLAYAMRDARLLQDAREELYLAALDLTLERHLWTPQFVAAVQARGEQANLGAADNLESSFTAVSDVSLAQRLPYGGEISARVINTLVRDLERHVTSAESGNVILSANLPLLRGAGRVAYESRYAAERAMIYAVRTYERFRRSFLVDIAAAFFDLQRLKAAIRNSYTAYQARQRDWERADYINRMGRSPSIFEAPRAKSSLRQAEDSLVRSKEQYATALDRFKILIGMPVTELLDVVDQDADQASQSLDGLLPDVDVQTAVDVALEYRLDLLTSADQVDDARRGVIVDRNRILPDLDFIAGATFETDPAHLDSLSYNLERNAWHGALELRLDDRKTERNAYRAALLGLRRAQRSHEEFVDSVRADVRRALRTIAQQADLRQIQELNVDENEFRLEAARAQFALGKSTNQDVVDAENDLLAARNDYATAVAQYRNAILRFRLDTGTLRIDDEGKWDNHSRRGAPE